MPPNRISLGSHINPSTRAFPNHPGQPNDCLHTFLHHWLQASPPPIGWPLTCKRNEIDIGFAFAKARVFAVKGSQPFSHLSVPQCFTWFVTIHHAQLNVERVIYISNSFQLDGLI